MLAESLQIVQPTKKSEVKNTSVLNILCDYILYRVQTFYLRESIIFQLTWIISVKKQNKPTVALVIIASVPSQNDNHETQTNTKLGKNRCAKCANTNILLNCTPNLMQLYFPEKYCFKKIANSAYQRRKIATPAQWILCLLKNFVEVYGMSREIFIYL